MMGQGHAAALPEWVQTGGGSQQPRQREVLCVVDVS